MSEDIGKTNISRREFLKLLGVFGAVGMVACTPRPVRNILENPQNVASKETIDFVDSEAANEIPLKFAGEVEVNLGGLKWTPDTNTSYLNNTDGTHSFFLAAGTESFKLEGKDILHLGDPKKVMSPSLKESQFGFNGYRGIGSVIRDGGRIWSFDHIEEWPSLDNGDNFTARVGLSLSKDQGDSFEDQGIVIDGKQTLKAGVEISGAGQPCAIVKNEGGVEYVYLYFTEWSKDKHYISLARAPLDHLNDPVSWSKYHNGSFCTKGIGGESSPVILTPEGEVYSSLASVSWNQKLEKYLCVFETGTGFWVASSKDATEWSSGQKIANFPTSHEKRRAGDYWYSYPSLISEEVESGTTSETGYLVYSKGEYLTEPHQMVTRQFAIG